MAKQVKLSARPRSESGRNAVKKIRARGAVPAVIYGGQGEPANLEVSGKEINSLLAHAVGENILVDLEIVEDGKTTNRLSLIQEVQHHPVKGDVLHVDFHAVSATEEIEAEVVLEPEGDAIGVKTYGGLLQQNLHTLPIKCLPRNLPELIKVDVTNLNVGEALHVSQIALPAGVTAALDGDVVAFLVSEPTVSAESSSSSSEEAAAPEVLKEKKPEAAEAKK